MSKVLKGCGVLKVDNDTIKLNDATNIISVDPERLIMDIVPFVSVPTTYSALSAAQEIDVKLRDAMIACGVMLAE